MKNQRSLPYQIVVDTNSIDIRNWPSYMQKQYGKVEASIQTLTEAKGQHEDEIRASIHRDAEEMMEMIQIFYRGRLRFDSEDGTELEFPVLDAKIALPENPTGTAQSSQDRANEAILHTLTGMEGEWSITPDELKSRGFQGQLQGRVTQVGGFVLLKPAFRDILMIYTLDEYNAQ